MTEKSTPFSMTIFRDGKHEEIDMNTFNFNRATLIDFGGNQVKTATQSSMLNAIIINLLGMSEDLYNDVDIISFGYGETSFKPIPQNKEEHEEYSNDRKIIEKNQNLHKTIAEKLFLPLIIDENGQVRDKETIKHNFGQITMFAHCFGTTFAGRIFSELFLLCSKYKISKPDFFDYIEDCMLVSFAPQHDFHWTKHMIVKSIQDEIIPTDDAPKKHFDGITITRNDSNTIGVYSSRLANETITAVNEHRFGLLKRDNRWNLKPFRINNYEQIYIGKNCDAVSQILSYALARNVTDSIRIYNGEISEKISLDQLESEIRDILSQFSPEDLEDQFERDYY